MCGVLGQWSGSSGFASKNVASALHLLNHRGPDDSGLWVGSSGLVLGHARLSIHDLTQFGHQPMQSFSGRFQIVFNGEIYNFLTLKKELEYSGFHFKGDSDTEVFLALCEQGGVEHALNKSEGMFAIALWDERDSCLFLARDRLGEKPLYYSSADGQFCFGSELKVIKKLMRHARFDFDQEAMALYLQYGYIPAPLTIYKEIHKLQPGTFIVVRKKDGSVFKVSKYVYWSAETQVEKASRDPFLGTFDEAKGVLDKRLREIVSRQLIADVPVGCFLSGGVDSSLITAVAQSVSSGKPIQTFSMGFHDEQFNEAPFAKAIAQHLNTQHTELYVDEKMALDVIPRLPSMYNEPFADSSQIPTFLVSQLAKSRVTVALSGDGGDELFGGYGRFSNTYHVWNKLSTLPYSVRYLLSVWLSYMPFSLVGSLMSIFKKGRSGINFSLNSLHQKKKMVHLLRSSKEVMEFYRASIATVIDPYQFLMYGDSGKEGKSWEYLDFESSPTKKKIVERLMLWDTKYYLPDDIMVKVDRAAMAVSLETRAPFLSHKFYDLAWSLPLDFKWRPGEGKRILKSLLCDYMPSDLIERPKKGFSVPLAKWLRQDLREWSEELLRERALEESGVFSSAKVRAVWASHLNGQGDFSTFLWHVLMFQSWLKAEKTDRECTSG